MLSRLACKRSCVRIQVVTEIDNKCKCHGSSTMTLKRMSPVKQSVVHHITPRIKATSFELKYLQYLHVFTDNVDVSIWVKKLLRGGQTTSTLYLLFQCIYTWLYSYNLKQRIENWYVMLDHWLLQYTWYINSNWWEVHKGYSYSALCPSLVHWPRRNLEETYHVP